jgi:hypothetical protein
MATRVMNLFASGTDGREDYWTVIRPCRPEFPESL